MFACTITVPLQLDFETYQVVSVHEQTTLTEASYGQLLCLLNLAKLILLV